MWTTVLAALTVVLLIGLFWPVLAAPVQGDDRYWYAETPGLTRGSYLDIVGRTVSQVPYFLDTGRFAPVALGGRRMIALATTQLAVASTTPFVAIQGLIRLSFLVAAVLAVYAYVSTARFRDAEGTVTRLSSATIHWVMIGFGALFVAGAQAHFPFRNGWLSYFPLTYGAVIAIFGSVAFAQWCVTALATPSRRRRVVAFAGMVAWAVFLISTYELYYPAAVLVPLAILRHPQQENGMGTRSKLALIGAFLVPFATMLLSLRVLITRICTQTECYSGVTPDLGPEVLVTAWRNTMSSVPGFGGEQFEAELADVGMEWPDPFLVDFAWLGLLIAAAVALLWWQRRRTRGLEDTDPLEAGLLWQLAAMAVFAGAASSVVMGLSEASREIITQAGLPYRNVVITWGAIALGFILGARAIALSRTGGWVPVVSLIVAAVIGLTAAYTFPRNLASVRANRMIPAVQSIESIHWELVLGDLSEGADARRCETYAAAEERIKTTWIGTRMKTGTQASFEYFHGAPFCSRWEDEG